jgi:hypothetical protein
VRGQAARELSTKSAREGGAIAKERNYFCAEGGTVIGAREEGERSRCTAEGSRRARREGGVFERHFQECAEVVSVERRR